MHGVGNSKGKGKGQANAQEQTWPSAQARVRRGREVDPGRRRVAPIQVPNCGEKGRKAARCPNERIRGKGKKGVYRVADEGGLGGRRYAAIP